MNTSKIKFKSSVSISFGILLFFGMTHLVLPINGQILKSVIYDFDGLTIGQTDLPEGDYGTNDLSYKIAANPLGSNDMLGDRVLQLNLNWNSGTGSFGRGISRFIEFDVNNDVFNFYFYNPTANSADALVDVIITEDDDQNNTYSYNTDDAWKKSLSIQGNTGWQLISIPLKNFTDSNPGGNGIFDATFTGNKGMLLMIEFVFNKNTSNNVSFFLDMICFTDGTLPTGANILDLPPLSMPGKCPLGAFIQKNKDDEYLVPSEIESLFPASPKKRIKYVNFFVQFAMDGSTTAKELPGEGVRKLLDNGYMPIISWEPLFQGYSRLDPVQPRLGNIINGDYNSYIDAFADKIKTYDDTVIIRFMHEFEGDWYPWSIIHNGQDPSKYIAAFRKVVDRFRNRGAENVKWMWCLNADYAPYEYYNWSVKAYPGDSYVDIVATDIYNTHYPESLPWWMSFRYKTAESYYYLTKYFSNKPLMICEIGCRERENGENPSSQTKGEWIAQMDKELQSNFSRIKGLVFLSANHLGDWRVNSSPAALSSMTENIWKDDYYFDDVQISIEDHNLIQNKCNVFPNPNNGTFTISHHIKEQSDIEITVINTLGQVVYSEHINNFSGELKKEIDLCKKAEGMYYLKIRNGKKLINQKIVLN
ncbi:MAG: glycosyl hydrolase [Bacteroidota bacterium]